MLGLGCEEIPPEECRVDEQPCETDLYKILKNLAVEQGREGNWDNVSALKEFWSVLSDTAAAGAVDSLSLHQPQPPSASAAILTP